MPGFSRFLLICFALLCTAAGVVAIVESSKPPVFTPAANTAPKPSPPAPQSTVDRQDVLDRLVPDRLTYAARSGVVTTSFSLKNTNEFAIKDFTIRFSFIGNSGTTIRTIDKTFYEIVPAKVSKPIRDAVLGVPPDQAARASARVIDYGVP